MLNKECQKSGIEGKTLGLHSEFFSELGDGNTRHNYENDGKNTENRPQVVKFG
jgi:hypothetical protein